MKRRLALLVSLLLASFATPAIEPAAGPAARRVLFVGNSLTYVNDLPRVLAQLGAAQPQALNIETRTFVAPGGTLAERWSDGAAGAALADGHWDMLVLQERGGVAACLDDVETRGTRECREMVAAHRAFTNAAAGRADRLILLETWSTSEAGQARVDAGTQQLARRSGATVVHCGDALVTLARRNGRRATFPDGVHPSPAATVVMAAQLLRALTSAAPVALPSTLRVDTFDTPHADRPLESQAGIARPALEPDAQEAAALLTLARRYR